MLLGVINDILDFSKIEAGKIELENAPVTLESLIGYVRGLFEDNAAKKGVDFVTSEKNLTKRYTQIDGEIALCQKKNQQFNWHGDFVFVEENKDMEKTMEAIKAAGDTPYIVGHIKAGEKGVFI